MQQAMFSNKEIGILYNRMENTLRIFGNRMVKGEAPPTDTEFWHQFSEQVPFHISQIKHCEVSYEAVENYHRFNAFIFLDEEFILRGHMWIYPIHDYKIISNIGVIHYNNEELEEYYENKP